MRMIRRFAIVVMTMMATRSAAAQNSTPGISEISASGRGEVSVTPNRAILVAVVENNASSASVASGENARIVASTLAGLRSAGATDAQLTNGGYSLNQNYDNGDRRHPDGFVARNSIRVEIPRVQDIGKMIDAAVAGGATLVAPIQYLGPDMPSARREALKAAVAESRRDAETMAEAAAGSLGRLISLTTGISQPMYGLQDVMLTSSSASAGGQATSIRPTDLTVAAVATGKWEFVPRR